MGITIVRKSRPGERRFDAETCLVLAGGAVSGGAFKIGGLKALNDFAQCRPRNFLVLFGKLEAGNEVCSIFYGHLCKCNDIFT